MWSKNFLLKILGVSLFVYVVMVCSYLPEAITQDMAVSVPNAPSVAAAAPVKAAPAPAAAAPKAAPATPAVPKAAPVAPNYAGVNGCVENSCQGVLSQIYSAKKQGVGQPQGVTSGSTAAGGSGFDWSKYTQMGQASGSGSGASSSGFDWSKYTQMGQASGSPSGASSGSGFDWSKYTQMGQASGSASGGSGGDISKYSSKGAVAQCLDTGSPTDFQTCLNNASDKDHAKTVEECAYCSHCMPVEHGKMMPSAATCANFAQNNWQVHVPAAYWGYAKQGMEQEAKAREEAAAKKAAEEKAAAAKAAEDKAAAEKAAEAKAAAAKAAAAAPAAPKAPAAAAPAPKTPAAPVIKAAPVSAPVSK